MLFVVSISNQEDERTVGNKKSFTNQYRTVYEADSLSATGRIRFAEVVISLSRHLEEKSSLLCLSFLPQCSCVAEDAFPVHEVALGMIALLGYKFPERGFG